MKTYVVTGANRGIGLELVRQIVAKGQQVIAGCRDPEGATQLHKLGPAVQIRRIDVSEPTSIRQFADWIEVSVPSVDVLINNAGVFAKSEQQGTIREDELMASYRTNTVGPLLLTQTLVPKLLRSSSPLVANITSKMGSIADNTSGGYYAYRMSKAALNMATMSLTKDHPQICFLVLHPGWVKTDMGGPDAPTSVDESARGLLEVMEKTKKSGLFLNYQGEEIPW